MPLPIPGVRLTRQGKFFIFGALIAALASYLLSHNLVMLASAMFMAIPIYQWAYLMLAVGSFEATWQWPDQLFAKRTSTASMTLVKKSFPSLAVCHVHVDIEGSKPYYQRVARLGKQSATTLTFELQAQHRGRLESTRWFLRSSSPFGLVERTRSFTWQQMKLVFPELLSQLPPSLSAKAEKQGALSRQSEDFQYLDSYREGDDVRMIHWRKSVLSEQPVMRRDHSRQQTLDPEILVPDASPYFEHAVKALATFFQQSDHMQTWLVLEANGLREIRDKHEMLAFLALVQPLNKAAVDASRARLDKALFFSEIFAKTPTQAKPTFALFGKGS